MIRIQIHLSHPNGPMLPTKNNAHDVKITGYDVNLNRWRLDPMIGFTSLSTKSFIENLETFDSRSRFSKKKDKTQQTNKHMNYETQLIRNPGSKHEVYFGNLQLRNGPSFFQQLCYPPGAPQVGYYRPINDTRQRCEVHEYHRTWRKNCQGEGGVIWVGIDILSRIIWQKCGLSQKKLENPPNAPDVELGFLRAPSTEMPHCRMLSTFGELVQWFFLILQLGRCWG